MNRTDFKRQLLTDLFAGRVTSLRTYKATRLQQNATPYRWVINDETDGTIYGIGQSGTKHLLTVDDLTNAPARAVWRIVDHSAGTRVPDADEV